MEVRGCSFIRNVDTGIEASGIGQRKGSWGVVSGARSQRPRVLLRGGASGTEHRGGDE